MSVRYKFKSEASFNQILFDGIDISVGDVRKEIYRQRRLGKSENIELMISNAETGEKYSNELTLIPKNSSLTIMRVPTAATNNNNSRKYFNRNQPEPQVNFQHPQAPLADLTTMTGTEEEKIAMMMLQSTADYKTSHPVTPPSTYVCRKCHIPGHFIRHCPLYSATVKSHRYDPKERRENKRMTGIPMSMRNLQLPEVKIDVAVKAFAIPPSLCCSMCRDVFRSPVMTPCCRATYCNECAVKALVESDEYECPKCEQKYIFPNDLISDDRARSDVERIVGGRHFAGGSGISVKV